MRFMEFEVRIKKNSVEPESNQRPKDNRITLQSSALPAELLSESEFLKPFPDKYQRDGSVRLAVFK